MSINRSKLMALHGRVIGLEAEIRAILLRDDVPMATASVDGLTIEFIQEVVAKSFRQPATIMTDKDRPQSKAWPRMIAMALSRELTQEGVVCIGKRFGGRDHGTVYSAVKAVKNRCDTSPETSKLVNELREFLRERNPSNNQ